MFHMKHRAAQGQNTGARMRWSGPFLRLSLILCTRWATSAWNSQKILPKAVFQPFGVGFLELFKKNSVWNRLRGFFERSKKPDFTKKQPFFGLRLPFFQAFSRLFRGFLFLSKRLKKAWKRPFLRFFGLILPSAQGKNAEKTTKEQRTRGSRADLNKKSDCFSGNSAKNWPCATIREWRADKERIKIVQRPFEIGENRNAPENKEGKSSEMIREKLCVCRRIIGKSK